MLVVLECYTDDVIKRATEPATGIQSVSKFPPSIAELKEFCDSIHRRSTYAEQYDARSREQLKERDRYEAEAKAESAEHRKAVTERIKADLRAAGFRFAGDAPDSTSREAERAKLEERLMQNFAQSAEQAKQTLNNLPNQPDKPDFWQGVRWPT